MILFLGWSISLVNSFLSSELVNFWGWGRWERRFNYFENAPGDQFETSRSLNFYMKKFLSYRNQFIDLLCKLMGWFLYDRSIRHERVNFWRKLTLWPFDTGLPIYIKHFNCESNTSQNSSICHIDWLTIIHGNSTILAKDWQAQFSRVRPDLG